MVVCTSSKQQSAMLVSSVQQSLRRRRHAVFFMAVFVGMTQLQLGQSQSHDLVGQNQRKISVEESKYQLTTLPNFHIKLEIDLFKVVTGGNTQNNLRQLLLESVRNNNKRRLSSNSGEGWVTNVDTTTNNHDDQTASTNTSNEPSKNNSNGGGWFSNTENDPNEYQPPEDYESVGGSWYADENSSLSSKPEQVVAVDPLSSLSTVKDALQQTNTDENKKKSLSEYMRNLLVEYTTDFVTLFAYEALQSKERATKGWDVVHAIDLRGSLLDVTFYHEETHFIEDSDKNNQEETFASLTFGFSGTAAILKGTNVDDIVKKGDTIGDNTGASGIINRPIIGSNELRLMLRGAFAPPDGPYKYLTYVLDESNSDRKDFKLDKMTYEDSLEHDATILLGGSREVTVRTDLDYPDGRAPFQSSTFVGAGSERTERRESIAVFFEGLFLVVFLGGFYMYASHKFRRNHLKQELMKYGEGAILVRSGEKTLFSPESKAKSRFQYMSRWLGYNRVGNSPSPTSMETLEDDGYFGSESFDSDDYNYDRDLEVGLKESYDESNRDKASGFDMEPIDVDSYVDYSSSPSGGVNTMKAIDDDTKENTQSTSVVDGLHQNVLENVLENGVVPIPAKDDYNAAYLMSKKGKSKRKKSQTDGGGDSVIIQRRYVQPAAPLDVLYGAAFLHGEADRVEAQRRLHKKKKIRASPSGRNRVKKKKKSTAKLVAQAMSGQRSKHAVNPMVTISESIDELAEEDYGSDEDEEDLIAPVSPYSPSSFMRNLSEWALGGKIGAEEEDDDVDVEGETDHDLELEVVDDEEGESQAEVVDSSHAALEEKENKSSSPSSGENDIQTSSSYDSQPAKESEAEEEKEEDVCIRDSTVPQEKGPQELDVSLGEGLLSVKVTL